MNPSSSSIWPSQRFDQTSSSSSDDSFCNPTESVPTPTPLFPAPLFTHTPPSTTYPPPMQRSQLPFNNSFLSSSSSSSSSSPSSSPFFHARRPSRKPKTIRGAKTSFIIGDKLGSGSHAVVREAIDEKSLRIVAVKILDLRRLRRCRGGLDAIEREVSVLKRLKKHPNLIELIDVVRLPERGKMYIVLEMANGCTVEQLAALAGGKLPELQVARIVYFVLLALQYMHGKGVVHRDIKPSNVMLTAGGHVKISDFGVAEFLNEYKSEDNVSRTSGSPAFQAPEIARGELGYSGMKVDVWALGVTTYLLLTGHIPFGGDNLIALFDTIAQGLYDEPDSFSPSLKDVIRRMLIVDWRARDSVDDLLKHPWVIKGSQRVSEQQQLEQAWQPIPRKHIRILDLVKRMYNEEIPTQTPTITTTHTSSPDGTSPKVSASSSSSACSVQ